MTKSVGVHEAKTHLSRLLDDVERGTEVVITRRGREVARLVATEPPELPPRVFGQGGGKAWIADDFDAPMPDEFYDMFEQ